MPGETRPPKRAMSARHLACPPAATRAQATRVVLTQPRSGMTRNGSAFALPTPEPRTAGTVSCSSPSGPAQPHGSRLLPGPVAGNYGDRASLPARQARRDRQKQPGRNGNGTGSPLPAAIALLPTPMAGDFGADRSACQVRPSGGRTADRPARPGRCDHLSGHRSGPAGSQAATRTERPGHDRPDLHPGRRRLPARLAGGADVHQHVAAARRRVLPRQEQGGEPPAPPRLGGSAAAGGSCWTAP